MSTEAPNKARQKIDIQVESSGDQGSDWLYEKHQKIYPREVSGRYQRLRNLAALVLLGIYYGLPWLRWDGNQAVLLDLPARKFHIFGLTIWPQDFIFLALLLIIAAVSLFFFTALAGRLWCGYACPQTVWTEAFLWMERITEGGHNKRKKLDKAPWNREKLLRKGAKHTLWLLFALWTGFTFVGFFTPIHDLAGDLLRWEVGFWQGFWVIFYSLATWGNAGFLREQVCLYMCPYARFQSAMFDRDTLIISYDEARGEKRGSRGRKQDPKALGLGDCIDCTLCVQVCPTGIDIRNGLQYECIACGACVDVCNSVMDKMGYERGLVRYTTENAVEHKTGHVLRMRTVVYGVLLTALVIGWTVAIANRSLLNVDVIRDRNALYRELADGAIENVYTLKIANKTESERRFEISLVGNPPLRLRGQHEVLIGSGDVFSATITLQAAPSSMQGGNDVEFLVRSEDGEVSAQRLSRFYAPVPES